MFSDEHNHMNMLNKYERLAKKDHKIKVGIEPTSPDNRSDILPLNYPIFSLA